MTRDEAIGDLARRALEILAEDPSGRPAPFQLHLTAMAEDFVKLQRLIDIRGEARTLGLLGLDGPEANALFCKLARSLALLAMTLYATAPELDFAQPPPPGSVLH